MTEPTRASSSPRHRGVVLVTGQSPSAVDRVADGLLGSTSHRLVAGPDAHDAADAVHRLALDLAHDGHPVDVVATLAAGTPSRATGLLLGSLLDSSLGRPSGRSLLQHVVSVVSAVELVDLVLGGVDDRFLAAEHVVDLVEYATVIVLVDTAGVSPRDLRTIRRLLARLAPESRVAGVDAVRRETLESPGGAAQLGGAAG
ncbi:hypothetical protein [Frigoribacterium sp. NPDC087798]|uniref:hypothetical protein n=1 Tax=Frigoribacterium sp. NPDC087798 TaxID=3363993 RepID=UPI0037F79199